MFSVIISEKGGAERRETFDRTEINVGRVQGNDLMLPKGNVSKRHARLLYRDGRFIVTDLKSTNGTYVNGRKIAQATIVREGDKIYIGDFVLRIESLASSSGVSAPAGASSPPPIIDERSEGSGARSLDEGPASVDSPLGEMTAAPSMAGTSATSPPPLHPPGAEGPSSSSHPSSAEKQIARPSPRIEDVTGGRGRQLDSKSDASREVISHFPLEHDPDDSVPYAVPGPPKMPAAVPRPDGSSPGATSRDPGSYPGSGSKPILRPPAPPSSATATPRHASPSIPPERTTSPSMGMASALLQSVVPGPQTIAAPAPSAAPNTPLRRALPPQAERESRDVAAQLARRSALRGLVDHVGAEVDFGPLATGIAPDNAYVERIDRALGDRVMSMKSRGELPPELSPEQLVLDARRELLELGPLTPLFDDEEVVEIHLMGHDHVVATMGRRQVPTDVAFTSEVAFERALRRLCIAAGQPLADDERFVERRLARGARFFVVRPTASDQGHMMVVRKPQRADLTLEDLVRSGTISRAIAGLLAQCVTARANILVTGSVGSGATSMLGALAAAGSTDDRVVVLQEDDELIFNQPHTVSILLGNDATDNARAVQAAARIRPDRLVVGAFAGVVAAEVVDAMGDGVDGVLAAARAPTLRQAASRLPADLAATRSGVPPETAREWLASAFDLVIEIARLRDGRHRVLRVAELAMEHGNVVVRDIFTFSIERTAAGGSVEGAFYPTGIVPGVVEDLVARGVQIDLSIFRRPSQR